jgi:hypothetical protein
MGVLSAVKLKVLPKPVYNELSAQCQITCLIEEYDRVVCNTSPLIKLAGVGLLDLLPQLYGAIWIPEAVRDEYLVRADVLRC